MRRRKLRGPILAVLLGLAGLAVLSLGAVNTSQAADPCNGDYTSSACTYYGNYYPVFGGCRWGLGWSCYYCEYTCDPAVGGWDNCGENSSGSIRKCNKCDPQCEPFIESPMP